MLNNFSTVYKRKWFISLLVIGLFCVIYIFPEIRNHGLSMTDFKVFYNAAERIIHGSNLYQVKADGHFVFKYSPTSALYFTPFVLFHLFTAKVLYWLLLSLLVVTAYYLLGKLFLQEIRDHSPLRFNNLILISFAAVSVHIIRELFLGQVNWVLLVFYLWMILAFVKQRPFQIALSLALSIFIKPFGLIFIPYLLLKRQTKALLYFVAISVFLFLIPLIFYDVSFYIGQLKGWLTEIIAEMGNKQALGAAADHTLFSVLYRYTPLRIVELSKAGTIIYQMLVLAGLGLAVLWFIKMGEGLGFAGQEDLALLVALIPLLAFTNENAFLFLVPAIVANLRLFRVMKLWEKIIFIAGIILLGGNIYEVWGNRLTQLILDYSVVAIGAILIIFVMFSVRYRRFRLSSAKNKRLEKKAAPFEAAF